MGAYVNVTPLYGNQDKRTSEAVVVTCPAMLDEGSQRVGSGPTYIKSGDAWTAAVIEADTIVKKAYLIVDEAFPSGATISVDIAGQSLFIDVPVDATGLTASTAEDLYFKVGQTVTVGITSGSAGTEVQTGVARIVIDEVSPSLRNGNYAAN